MKINTVAKQLLFDTVRIEGFKEDGTGSVGTGFVISHTFQDYGREVFLVTNKHVVQGINTSKLCFTRRVKDQPVLGHTFGFDCAEGFGSTFHGHPIPDVDIAVLPLSFPLQYAQAADRDAFFMNIDTSIIPEPEELESFDAIVPVIFVGYPNGLFDTVNRTPIIRRGTSATPLQLDYDGRPVFLIDASVFPGSSGSPVFSYSETWEGGIAELRLLGIVAEVLVQEDTGEFHAIPAPTEMNHSIRIRQMLDLGVVFKSGLILETILDCWNHKGEYLKTLRKGQ